MRCPISARLWDIDNPFARAGVGAKYVHGAFFCLVGVVRPVDELVGLVGTALTVFALIVVSGLGLWGAFAR